jgi:hypothetical protein
MQNLAVTRTISITFTADDWGLYDDDTENPHEFQRDAVAIILNEALEQCVNLERLGRDDAFLTMSNQLRQYDENGADDTIVRMVLRAVIHEIYN